MKEIFVKKYWDEEKILFYLHFEDGEAVRQIEVTQNNKVFLTIEIPIIGDSMLYDQSLEGLELEEEDFITKLEFDKVWEENKL
jgi:hypothetical protein